MEHLRDYQRNAVYQILEGRRGLFYPYGLGKTVTSLTSIKEGLLSAGRHFTVAVFCKKRNVITWKRELRKWFGEDIGIGEVQGSVKACEKAYAEFMEAIPEYERNVVIITYPTVAPKLALHMKYLELMDVQALIADESTVFKNPKSNLTKAMLRLSARFPGIPRIPLTGNPKPEGEYEVWSQLQFTGHNPFEPTYYSFLRKWFVKPDRGNPVLKLGMEQGFRSRLERVGVWIHPEDLKKLRKAAGVPLEQPLIENYKLSKIQRDTLKQLYNDWELPDVNGEIFEMNYTLSLHQKAQQICSGFYYDDNKNVVSLFADPADNPKLVALSDVLKQLFVEKPTRKIMIWYLYKAEREILYHYISDSFSTISAVCGPDEEALEAFLEDPYTQVLLMPVDISEGFNELVVADVDIYFSNTFKQEKRDQAEARIARSGNKADVVFHIDLASNDGRDMEVVTALQNKSLNPSNLSAIMNRYTSK